MVSDKKAGRGESRPSRPRKRVFHGNQHTKRKGGVASTSSQKSVSKTHKEQTPAAETLGDAIPEIEEPVVFNNLLRDSDGKNLWKFLDWDLDDIAEKLGDLKLRFRIGLNARTAEQQWDFKCKGKTMKMKEFLENVESLAKTNEWLYFDYKYMNEWFNDNPELLSSIDWQRFGFDKQGADSTLWIGSQGAHTNCHQDSYGCNLITQTHGRKRWLLFPPDSGLRFLNPTRIPYEESTVYTGFNFFCPSKDEEVDILRTDPRARMIVLEPGQVLLVPSGWWHYVESIDLSISVNIWLPLPKDCQSRLGEAVVKLLINEIGKGMVPAVDESTFVSSEAVSLVQKCIEQCTEENEAAPPPEKKIKRIDWTAKKLVREYPNYVALVPALEPKELKELLSGNRNRFPDIERQYSQEDQKEGGRSSGTLDEEGRTGSLHKKTTNILINALCHPDVIAKVSGLLLQSSQSN